MSNSISEVKDTNQKEQSKVKRCPNCLALVDELPRLLSPVHVIRDYILSLSEEANEGLHLTEYQADKILGTLETTLDTIERFIREH
ncbi:MAG: hypothetical protein JRI96_05535 [Deltaproteobacteria bacterium]|nr:hypothetical protein [Deltaproteobacteria bacterium]